MSKKKFYIITTCCVIAVLIIFEFVMYHFVGEVALMEKGIMRMLWLSFPVIFVLLSTFVRDYIIKRKYKHNDDNDKS
ncbi:MAG: hypothetical protein K2L36_08295 [Eubacterium sp.]|nr:hypothetical protein [Eubacterium sp.]